MKYIKVKYYVVNKEKICKNSIYLCEKTILFILKKLNELKYNLKYLRK